MSDPNSNSPLSENQSSAIVVYQFDTDAPIRVISDSNGDPWFVASDVCTTLGLGTEQTRRLDEDEKGLHSVQTPGGPQQMVIINESGLYSLILTSRKPEAKRFKKWITSEVLPAIRKTGQYSISQLSPLDQLKLTVAALEDHQKQLLALNSRVERIEDTYEADQGAPQLMTVRAYCTWRKLRFSDGELQSIGRKAKRYCDAHMLPYKEIPHAVFGVIKEYHIEALQAVTAQRSMYEGK